jgi:CDGSH-type Zn-finger protein
MTERVTIETEPNGPYIVRGPVTLIDADGARREFGPDSVIKLCRCGHSARKPFCDSTHRLVDFVSRPRFEPEPRR